MRMNGGQGAGGSEESVSLILTTVEAACCLFLVISTSRCSAPCQVRRVVVLGHWHPVPLTARLVGLHPRPVVMMLRVDALVLFPRQTAWRPKQICSFTEEHPRTPDTRCKTLLPPPTYYLPLYTTHITSPSSAALSLPVSYTPFYSSTHLPYSQHTRLSV